MSDINDLYYQRNRANQRKCDLEARHAQINQKIERLETARSRVESIKQQINGRRSEASWLSNVERWEGEKCNQYKEVVSDRLMNGFITYYNQTDDVRDAINSEITRLENESRDVQGVMGDVLNWLNDLSTAINNFFN